MKRLSLSTILAVLVLLATVGAAVAAVQNYRAHLSGRFEIPAVVDTQAEGQAIFQLSNDGTTLHYKLNVANIENVTQAHIHRNPSGTGNGPIVVWLYPSAPPLQLIPGRTDGQLAEGEITAANLTGPLAGKPLGDLIALIEAGQTYVNVHTTAFPGGEIHGPVH
jgi:hypothetical protein